MKIDRHVKSWYGMLSTFFTVGCYSKMPGTLGSCAACIIWILFKGVPCWIIIATVLLGWVSADIYEKKSGRSDPGEVVIDEVVGYWLAVYGLGMNYTIIALFVFRIIDILKPFPVNIADRKVSGGLGIMLDDIIGGVMVNLLLRFLNWFCFGGGMELLIR